MILEELKAENYKIGPYQAIKFDRNNPLFGETYLPDLYFALGEGRRTKFRRENLQMLFCGMTDLSLPAIIAYWNTQKLIILGKWEGEVFRTGGVCWTNATVGTKRKAAFGAYGFLRWTWGTDEVEILGWLAMAAMFENIHRINGQGYVDNHLSGKYMNKFGFKDCGILPELLVRGDELVDCILRTCSRDDFEGLLTKKIVEYSV